TTYDQPGTYQARLRVIDSGDSTVTATVTVKVLPPPTPATILFSPASPSSGSTPLTDSYGATVTGVTPTAYLWDFDADGVVDAASLASPSSSFIFRTPGTFFARLLVRNSTGAATLAVAPAVMVTSGGSPPTIGSFTATGGILPYASVFTVAHSDLGAGGIL